MKLFEMLEWAEEELKRYDNSPYGKKLNKEVLEILKLLLSNQNQSNIFVQLALSSASQLWSRRPLTPLTGEDNEWDGEVNKRYYLVIRDKKTGVAYDIDGRCFQEPDSNCCFRCRESRMKIEFPYMPKGKIPVYKLKYKADEVPIKEALEKGLYEIV